FVQRIEQFIAPNEIVPKWFLAWPVAPHQRPFRHNRDNHSRHRATEIKERKEKQRFRQRVNVVQQQKCREQEAQQDDKTRRGEDDTNKLNNRALYAEPGGRIKCGFFGKSGAFLALRKENRRRSHPG